MPNFKSAAVEKATAADSTPVPEGGEDVGFVQPTGGQPDRAPSGSDSSVVSVDLDPGAPDEDVSGALDIS